MSKSEQNWSKSEQNGSNSEQDWSELVRIGQIRNRIGQIGQNRNDSERFFRKFRIRNEVPIIGTSGNPATFTRSNTVAVLVVFLEIKKKKILYKKESRESEMCMYVALR